MLDYGYRSKCCFAPIRSGDKKLKNSTKKVKIWICTKCGATDVDIVPKDEALSQKENIKPEVDFINQPIVPKPVALPDVEFFIEIISFGFDKGMIPVQSNMLLDVRSLAAPESFLLKTEKSGLDKEVQDLILDDNAQALIGPFYQTILRLFPYYQAEKKRLVVSIGCSKGIHRSVAVTESIALSLTKRNLPVKVIHRDLPKTKE